MIKASVRTGALFIQKTKPLSQMCSLVPDKCSGVKNESACSTLVSSAHMRHAGGTEFRLRPV
jgi:hypothetical protein